MVGPSLAERLPTEQRSYYSWPNVSCTTEAQRNYSAVVPTKVPNRDCTSIALSGVVLTLVIPFHISVRTLVIRYLWPTIIAVSAASRHSSTGRITLLSVSFIWRCWSYIQEKVKVLLKYNIWCHRRLPIEGPILSWSVTCMSKLSWNRSTHIHIINRCTDTFRDSKERAQEPYKGENSKGYKKLLWVWITQLHLHHQWGSLLKTVNSFLEKVLYLLEVLPLYGFWATKTCRSARNIAYGRGYPKLKI